MIKQKLDFDPKNFYIKNGYENQAINYNDPENREDDYWSKGRQSINILFQQDTYRYAREIIKKYNIESVADVGCGVGEKLNKFISPLDTTVVGIDLPESINIAQKKYTGEFIADNFDNDIPLVKRKFDLVICSDVIEHIVNPDTLINYIKKITHSNSLIIFSTPERDYHRGFDCMKSNKPEHIREWNTLELKNYLESRSLTVKEHFTIDFISPSILIPRSIKFYRELKRKTGTTKTTQVVLCFKNEITT